MKIRRIMIAAPKSGSGKTTITCALLQALKNKGEQIVSYKCGPDYIDPMFHERVMGIPSKNLDTFFTGEEETRRLFLTGRTGEEFAVLEGVMGLFDGLSGIREEGSSYHLAKVTKTPIILVVDAKGMGRSLIPLIGGFLAYDKERLIKGVLLNRMSKSYYEVIKPFIEEELKIEVLGYFPERKDWYMESRHLGLVKPDELSDIKKRLEVLGEEFVKTVSLENIVNLAKKAAEIPEDKKADDNAAAEDKEAADGPVIAVAKDEAFCFYYEDNLRMLKENGAVIKYFSPLHDACLPKDCHGILIGGGYPELYAKQLSGNVGMRRAIKRAFDHGMPFVAECGGFMYLHSRLKDKEGISYDMAGAVCGECFDTEKLVRFGYVEIREKQGRPWGFLQEGEGIKGHEFHYYDSTNNGEGCLGIKPVTGKEYACVITGENYWLGFPHLYYPSNPSFAKEFVDKAEKYRKESDQQKKSQRY